LFLLLNRDGGNHTMRNTLINVAIVIMIILLPACATNKDATNTQHSTSTDQDKKVSTSNDDYDSYRY
jgi:ABC-type Zn uptake system ZnuABC Zn-binding protein ZnuA